MCAVLICISFSTGPLWSLYVRPLLCRGTAFSRQRPGLRKRPRRKALPVRAMSEGSRGQGWRGQEGRWGGSWLLAPITSTSHALLRTSLLIGWTRQFYSTPTSQAPVELFLNVIKGNRQEKQSLPVARNWAVKLSIPKKRQGKPLLTPSFESFKSSSILTTYLDMEAEQHKRSPL